MSAALLSPLQKVHRWLANNEVPHQGDDALLEWADHLHDTLMIYTITKKTISDDAALMDAVRTALNEAAEGATANVREWAAEAFPEFYDAIKRCDELNAVEVSKSLRGRKSRSTNKPPATRNEPAQFSDPPPQPLRERSVGDMESEKRGSRKRKAAIVEGNNDLAADVIIGRAREAQQQYGSCDRCLRGFAEAVECHLVKGEAKCEKCKHDHKGCYWDGCSLVGRVYQGKSGTPGPAQKKRRGSSNPDGPEAETYTPEQPAWEMVYVEPAPPALPEPPSRPKRVPATPSTARNIARSPPRASPAPASHRKQVPTAPSAMEDVVEPPPFPRQLEQSTSLPRAGNKDYMLARVVEDELLQLETRSWVIRTKKTVLVNLLRIFGAK